jgi:uroporphyrin-3 C-methyltransferase
VNDTTEPLPAAEVTSAPAAPVRQSRNWLAVIALFFSLLAIAAAAGLMYRDDIKRELTDYRMQSLLQDQAGALSQLRQQLAEQRTDNRSAREQFNARINQLQAQLETQQQRLTQLANSDRSEWQLAEAEYLLQLANQRLLLGGDVKTALEQFAAADTIIRNIEDSSLLPTRAALAKDIAALKAVDVVDTDGIYLTIEAVAEQAQQLHLVAPVEAPEKIVEPENPNASLTEKFQTGLRAALKKLGLLVQIRRRDEPYKPLLAPQYEAALQQNVKLAFEQAQAALLTGNQKLYVHSLGKARDWLQTYYTVDEHATQMVVQSVDELRGKQITYALPDISESRRELKAYMNARRAQLPGASPAGAAR